ncbi:MAG: NAD-dependent epimerase/dehydratase family protein [Nitrospirales bacterium]
MRVLVTGGAGFIGSHSVDRLLANGWTVRILDNFSSGSRKNLPTHPALEILEGDIRQYETVKAAMEGVSHVLHLAAQVSVQASVENPPHSCSTNILGFVNVLQAARSGGIQRLVYASSAAVYGAPTRIPIVETDACHPISPYGLEKQVNDQYAGLFAEGFHLSLLGLRYFNVYGPRQDPRSPYAGVISKFLARIEQYQPLLVYGDGSQTRDFIFVKDVARANVAALESSLTGVCHVATGTSCNLLQMIDILARCTKRQLDIIHEAPMAGDILFSSAKIDRFRELLNQERLTTLEQGLGLLVQDTIGLRSL